MSTIVRGSNYDELPVPVQKKLDEFIPGQRKLDKFLSPVQRKLDEDCVPVQYEDEGRCKSEPDSTSAGVFMNSSSSSVTKRSQFSSRQEPSSSKVPVSFMEDRTSCCYERRKLSDSGGRQAAVVNGGSSPIPDAGKAAAMSRGSSPSGKAAGMGRGSSLIQGTGKLLPCAEEAPRPASCCHRQRKFPDPGGGSSCRHGRRKLPDPGGGSSCRHKQRKLPDPENIQQEVDKVLVTNCGAGEPSTSSTSVSNNKAGVPNMSSSYDHDRFKQRPEQSVRLLSPRVFIQRLEEDRTHSERSKDSTQPDESLSTRRSPETRSPRSSMRYQQHQPMKKQLNPDQSNSWLPIRLAHPKKSPNRWAQQRKVPPDPTPFVPVKTQSDRLAKVKFDGGMSRINSQPAQ